MQQTLKLHLRGFGHEAAIRQSWSQTNAESYILNEPRYYICIQCARWVKIKVQKTLPYTIILGIHICVCVLCLTAVLNENYTKQINHSQCDYKYKQSVFAFFVFSRVLCANGSHAYHYYIIQSFNRMKLFIPPLPARVPITSALSVFHPT